MLHLPTNLLVIHRMHWWVVHFQNIQFIRAPSIIIQYINPVRISSSLFYTHVSVDIELLISIFMDFLSLLFMQLLVLNFKDCENRDARGSISIPQYKEETAHNSFMGFHGAHWWRNYGNPRFFYQESSECGSGFHWYRWVSFISPTPPLPHFFLIW